MFSFCNVITGNFPDVSGTTISLFYNDVFDDVSNLPSVSAGAVSKLHSCKNDAYKPLNLKLFFYVTNLSNCFQIVCLILFIVLFKNSVSDYFI